MTLAGDLSVASGIIDPKFPEALTRIAEAVIEGECRTVSVAGAQGSGKTTLAGLLTTLLSEISGKRVTGLSIDDFYLTRSERQRLAKEIHPMLATRGVPGTHDMKRMRQVIQGLLGGQSMALPVFSKARDDRETEPRQQSPVDMLVLEGWCWGAVPQSVDDLNSPVNALEADQDPERHWRRWVNEQLASDDYQQAFNNDYRVFLAVPSMASVMRWRWQQEQSIAGQGTSVMNEDQVRSFIMYYERISTHMLHTVPSMADLVIRLAEDHTIERIEGR